MNVLPLLVKIEDDFKSGGVKNISNVQISWMISVIKQQQQELDSWRKEFMI